MPDKNTFTIENLYQFKDISDRVHEFFKAGGKKLDITVETVGKKRSCQQNAYYWSCVVESVAVYYAENPADLIRDVMKATETDFTVEFTHELLKLGFNKGKSTTKLDTASMEQFIFNIREHFYHTYNLDIPEPNQPPIGED